MAQVINVNFGANTAQAVENAPVEVSELLAQLAVLKSEAKKIDTRKKEVEAGLKDAMEAAGVEHVAAAGHNVHYTTCKRSSFDNKAYAKAHPRVASRYMKESKSMRLTLD